jgi:FkbM family methyltransferase
MRLPSVTLLYCTATLASRHGSDPNKKSPLFSLISLLRSTNASAPFWYGGTVPRAHDQAPRKARGVCPHGKLIDSRPLEDVSAPHCAAFWPRGPCVVYSIGIGGHWGFEDAASKSTHCIVHAYDPTEQLRRTHEAHRTPRVTFHYFGLGGSRSTLQNTASTYGKVSRLSLLTLQQMVDMNGGSLPTVIKIDCEGCEWHALAQMATETPSVLARTTLLFLEVHVATALVPSSVSEEVMRTAWEYLIVKLGFRLWYTRDNPGYWHQREVVPFLNTSGLIRRQCCYELAFVRQSRSLLS